MHHRAVTAFILLVIFVSVSFEPMPVAAQDASHLKPYLIKNINIALTEGSNPHNFMPTGPLTYFFANQADGKPALWKTDGTSAGTSLVYPGISGGANSYATYKGMLYFPAYSKGTGLELWRTDGTANGTQLFLDIYPGVNGSEPNYLTVFGDRLYFGADWDRLYSTDGTPGNTTHGGEELRSPMVEFKGSLYYSAYAPDYIGNNDQSYLAWFGPGGSGHSTNLTPGSHLIIYKDRLYFDAKRADVGWELFSTAGPLESISLVKDINPTGDISINSLAEYNGLLYFVETDTQYGYRLWRTDGTEAGTIQVFDPTDNSEYLQIVGAVQPSGAGNPGGLLFYIQESGGGSRLFRTDGAPGSIQELADLRDIPEEYNLKYDLYEYGQVCNNAYYFPAYDAQHGVELWRSDGTTSGTSRLADIWPGAHGSLPNFFSPCGNGLYFSADDGIHGAEFWRTDGTLSGTKLVADLNTHPSNSNPWNMTPAGNLVYFYARDTVADPNLWRTDGTTAGTFALNLDPNLKFQIDPNYYNPLHATQGTTLYFPAYDPAHGEELWKTDGTPGGTALLKDIWPGSSSSKPNLLVVAGDRLFFFATSPQEGEELWVSDGTSSGTHLVKEIAPGIGGIYPTNAVVLGDQVIFSISNSATGNYELWRTDGSSAGTWMVYSGLYVGYVNVFTVFNGKLYFPARQQGQSYSSLWETDGTANGTKEISLGSSNYNFDVISNLTPTEEALYFFGRTSEGEYLFRMPAATGQGELIASFYNVNGVWSNISETAGFGQQVAVIMSMYTQEVDGPGLQLWVSDGSQVGTHRITAGFTDPSDLTPAGNILFFSASDPLNGEQIWSTDGTIEQTKRFSSYPQRRCRDAYGLRWNDTLLYRDGGFILSLDDALSNPPGYGCELWGLKNLPIDLFLPGVRR